MNDYDENLFENEVQDEQSDITNVWKEYEEARAYQDNVGLSQDVPMFVDFYEGRQWAKPTEKTKLLPRPVFNVVKMIVRSKKAAILSTPVQLVFKTDDQSVSSEMVDRFNHFANYIQKEMRQNERDADGVQDGAVKGSYIFHYYWDTEAKGKAGIVEGGLRCELLDVLNVFVANPRERDEQKQKWIIISSREEVGSVRAKADKGVDLDSIQPDESDERYNDKEQENSKLVTVLTKYFRQNGEVFCMKATKNVIVNAPFSITPDIDGVSYNRNEAHDAPNNTLADKASSKIRKDRYVATLYPIVIGNYERKEKSIYGQGEVEGIIPNQKAVNFTIAMQVLETQDMGWGKYIAKKDALKGQQITNEPGQVIIDYSADGNGIKRMEAPQFSAMPLNLVNAMLDMTRVVTGSTEVMTGETLSGNMSGAAIAQLQSQAQLPIEELQERFWRVKEKQGRVLAQAFKMYYEGKEFVYEKPVKSSEEKPEMVTDVFNGSEYVNTDFTVVVEATAGTRTTAAGDITMLDSLLQIQAIDIETYIDCYPQNAVSNKTKLLESMRKQKESQIAILSEQVAQKDQQILQLTEMMEQQKEVVDKAVSAIRENETLKKTIVLLYGEAKQKIEQANMNAKMSESDAALFANIIGNELGIVNGKNM